MDYNLDIKSIPGGPAACPVPAPCLTPTALAPAAGLAPLPPAPKFENIEVYEFSLLELQIIVKFSGTVMPTTQNRTGLCMCYSIFVHAFSSSQ